MFPFTNQVELDIDREVGFPIRAELGQRTGRTSVPSIWIGGKFIGGCNDGPVLSASRTGETDTVQVRLILFSVL